MLSVWMLMNIRTAIAIYSAVCREINCQVRQVLRKSAKKNGARDVAIYLARRFNRSSDVELGIDFENIYGAAFTSRYIHTSKQIRRNRRLKGRANRIKN